MEFVLAVGKDRTPDTITSFFRMSWVAEQIAIVVGLNADTASTDFIMYYVMLLLLLLRL